MVEENNPLAKQSDIQIINNSFGQENQWAVEMMRRLKETLEAEMRVANEVSAKIHGLNWALFWYTVVLGLITAFQFGAWLRDMTR